MTIVSQVCASDATTLANAPTRNFANEVLLSVMSGSDFRLTYMYFNRPFPVGATIVSATLTLHQRGVRTGGTRVVTVRNLAAAWKESTINSNNRPGFVAGTSASVTKGNGGVDGDVWEFDVSALLQEVSDGLPWYGFRVEGDIASLQYFYARQSAVFGATLDIEWSDAPDKPSILSPSNGRAVSIVRPTLRFDFTDVSGDTSLQAFQVQANATDVFTAPTYDTGTVAANIPEWLLDFDVAVAAVWFWRVRVQDGAGIWSDWSDSTSFTRTDKTPVAITNPAASPDDFVSEATPPISWTATGQTAYQVFITDAVDLTEVLWTTGKVTSADNSVSVPDRVPAILSPGGSYAVVVRIWDDVARESTPGDPIYTDASRTFTFELSATVDPVTSFTVTDAAPRPEATLGWVRSTAPDSFTILRDGKVIAANVEAADLLVTGTTYAYTDLGASPRTEHTWSVIAVVNGVSSDDNPTDTATLYPEGVWLSKLDGTDAVCITGDDPVSWEASEDSTVYYALGATDPILITQAVHGRPGTLSGFLSTFADIPDVSLADWCDNFDALRDPPGQILNMTLSDTSIRVFIFKSLREPLEDEYLKDIPVSFSFCELKSK